jgi:hypothetical protein
MSYDRFTLEARIHQSTGTGFLLFASGIGQYYINDVTGMFLADVNKLNREWKKKFYSATSIPLGTGIPFTGGK